MVLKRWARHLRVGLEAAIICLGLIAATPARAQANCDSYPEQLSETDIAALRELLILRSPVRHVELAHRVRIVNAADTPELAPFAERRGALEPTISIPVGFRRLQCRLVQAGLYYSIDWPRDRPPVNAFLAECMGRQDNVATCVAVVADRIIDLVGPLDAETWGIVKNGADAAFLNIILHEFAHIALGHFRQGATEATIEVDADAYAMLQMAVNGQSTYGLFSTFSALSLADPFLENGGGPHGRYACRAMIARQVVQALRPVVIDVFTWAGGPAADYLAQRARTQGYGPPPSGLMGDAAGCQSGDAARLAAIERDLQALRALTDRLAREAPAPLAAIEAVLDLPLVTSVGKGVQLNLASRRMRQDMFLDERVGLTPEQLALARRILDRRDVALMGSTHYGRLLALVAITEFETLPSGSDADRADAALRPRLERAEYYNPAFVLIAMHLTSVAYRQGRCPEGQRLAVRAVVLAENPAPLRLIAETLAEAERRVGCAAVRDQMKAILRRERSWR